MGRYQSQFILDENESQHLAIKLASFISFPSKLYFTGEIGMGKTTFIRALLQALGVTDRIKSPTYTLVEEYQIDEKKLLHFDLYRIEVPEELAFLGWEELFSQAQLVCLEWPEKAESMLIKPDIWFEFDYYELRRQLTVIAFSERGETVLKQLEAAS